MSSPSSPLPSRAALGLLLASSAGLTGLSVYQWAELLEVRAGRTPACAINETFNCATVWNSPFASTLHAALGIPVAGLGVVWGVVALAMTVLLWRRATTALDGLPFLGGLKLWAWAGLLSCVTFVTASIEARAVCLTCLGTYALVVVFAVAALALLPGGLFPEKAMRVPALGWSLLLLAPVYLALLYPGSRTPRTAQPAKLPVVQKAEDTTGFAELVQGLSQEQKLTTAWARAQWKKGVPQDTSMYLQRARRGPADAKVKLVEFTDILCGHCRQFEALIEEMAQATPPGSFSVEPRYYPLDGACNPHLSVKAGDAVRCMGARLQLCLEGHPKFFEIRHELFENQQRLDETVMMEIATKHGASPLVLQACLASAETDAKLKQDLDYAKRHNIQGTPLVLLNGREAPPDPVFLMGMVLSGGDPDAPYFLNLPPPPAE